MQNEYSDRAQAIKSRLAGQLVVHILRTLGRSKEWFHKWWNRYLELGPDGLFDLTHINHQVAQRIAPELERTILTIRRRLQAHAQPQTRYQLIGATTILAELKALQIRPLPCVRTIERVLERNGVTVPKLRLPHTLPSHLYPGPQAHDSNQLHQVDLVGPVYLKGQRQRYYIFVCKDAFDGAVCLKLDRSRKMEEVLAFLADCWKRLGLPAQMQFDNAREFTGWGQAAHTLSRVIRLCLRFGVEPVFIPPARPQRQGSVEYFNGWFQPLLFESHFAYPSGLQRELQRMQETVNTLHVHQRLGGLTPKQYRRRHKLRKLPPSFTVPEERVPLSAGRVTFIWQVSWHGTIKVLSQKLTLGKRLKGRYVKAILDTQRGWLTVYLDGRIFKRWDYPLLIWPVTRFYGFGNGFSSPSFSKSRVFTQSDVRPEPPKPASYASVLLLQCLGIKGGPVNSLLGVFYPTVRHYH